MTDIFVHADLVFMSVTAILVVCWLGLKIYRIVEDIQFHNRERRDAVNPPPTMWVDTRTGKLGGFHKREWDLTKNTWDIEE